MIFRFIPILLLLLGGCADLGFVDPAKYKVPAEKQVIEVEEDITFDVPSRSGSWIMYQYILPKGEYVSVFEDEEGTFFESPYGHYRDVRNNCDSRGGIYWPKDGVQIRLSWWPPHESGRDSGLYVLAGSGKVPLRSVYVPNSVRSKLKGPYKVPPSAPAKEVPVAPQARPQ